MAEFVSNYNIIKNLYFPMARMPRMARMARMPRMARWLAEYPDPKFGKFTQL